MAEHTCLTSEGSPVCPACREQQAQQASWRLPDCGHLECAESCSPEEGCPDCGRDTLASEDGVTYCTNPRCGWRA